MPARLFAAILCCAAAARAAEITHVATAGEDDRPVEVDLDATYVHTRTETKITREQTTPAGIALHDELTSVQTLDAIDFKLAIGVWHDLELHVLANLAIKDAQDWSYASGINASNSTLTNNRLGISGGGPGAVNPIVAVPGQGQRKGLFDPTVGFAWKPINELKEPRLAADVYPEGHPAATWVIGFDYTLPLGGGLDDPSQVLAGKTTGESRKANVFALWTAFSKRYRVLEPYVRFEGDAPFATSKSYDNCSNPQLLADVATANCASAAWKGQTGYQPPIEAAVTAGVELVVMEDRAANRRFSIDLRGDTRWHGSQRGYTQATDMLGKLTYADQYLTTVGQLGLYGHIARFMELKVVGMLGVDSAHFITDEETGEDKNGDGQVTISGGTGKPAIDQNPNFDYRVDQVGRRLRAEPAMFWGIAGTLRVSF
jgi:hypothetical protein